MRKTIMLCALSLLITGCAEESPFVGTWAQDNANSELRVLEGNECQLVTDSTGRDCTWKAVGQDEIRVTFKEDGSFVEATGKMLTDALLVKFHNGTVGFFERAS